MFSPHFASPLPSTGGDGFSFFRRLDPESGRFNPCTVAPLAFASASWAIRSSASSRNDRVEYCATSRDWVVAADTWSTTFLLQHCRRHLIVDRSRFLHGGSTTTMIQPPSSLHMVVFDTLGILALLSSLRFLRDNRLNIDKLELVYLCGMGVSSNPLLATVWTNPQFCPDIRLDLYWPGVFPKLENSFTSLTNHL